MVSAMIASTVAWGSEIRPNTDKPKVILWATENAVNVFIHHIRFESKKTIKKGEWGRWQKAYPEIISSLVFIYRENNQK